MKKQHYQKKKEETLNKYSHPTNLYCHVKILFGYLRGNQNDNVVNVFDADDAKV